MFTLSVATIEENSLSKAIQAGTDGHHLLLSPDGGLLAPTGPYSKQAQSAG
jgi:hypothetical protein